MLCNRVAVPFRSSLSFKSFLFKEFLKIKVIFLDKVFVSNSFNLTLQKHLRASLSYRSSYCHSRVPFDGCKILTELNIDTMVQMGPKTKESKWRWSLTCLTPSRLIKRLQMAILDNVLSGNHKQSVTRTCHQDEPRKARPARVRQAFDLRHSPQTPLQSWKD